MCKGTPERLEVTCGSLWHKHTPLGGDRWVKVCVRLQVTEPQGSQYLVKEPPLEMSHLGNEPLMQMSLSSQAPPSNLLTFPWLLLVPPLRPVFP